jgi:predicted glycosyltransferase
MNYFETDGNSTCVMTYSHDGFGLGHLRRNTTIASVLARQVPDSSVLMLIGCPSGAVFKLPTGVDFIKLPSVIKRSTGVWLPLRLRIGLEKTKALRVATIQEAVRVFHPQVLLVDHVPVGIWGELLPSLQMLKRRSDAPRIVLGLRDILDAPEVTRTLWEREGTYEAIRRYYDEIFIYGRKEIFDTGAHYGLDGEFAPKLRYVGYVCEQEPYKSQDEMRNELHVENKLLVVTGGGGADAFPMMLECMKAFKLLGANSKLEAIFITGPLMEGGQREHLRELAIGLKARVLAHVDDHLNYMNAADLVVTMAGYNSLYQLVRLRKKGLVIPRPGPSAEQQTRARLFSQRGLVDAIFPGELSPKRLADKLMGDLERTDYPIYDRAMDTDGSRKASDRLAEHLTAARISSTACYILNPSDTWHGKADASLDRTLRGGE